MALALLVVSCVVAAGFAAMLVARYRNPKLREQRLNRLCIQGPAAMRTAKFEKCVRIYTRALKLASGARLGAIYRQIGICRQCQGLLDEALESFAESGRIADEHGDKKGKAQALGNMGLVWQRRGDHDKAMDHYDRSIALYRESRDRIGEAIAQSNIGLLWKTAGDLDRALSCFQQALSVFREFDDKSQMASVLGNIALIHQDRDEYDMALECLGQTLAIARDLGDRRLEAAALVNIASTHVKKGQPDKGLATFEALLTVHREMGDQDAEARDLAGIGQALTRKLEHGRAADYLAQAMKAFLRLGIADGPRQILPDLRMCLTMLGTKDFSAACAAAKLEPRTISVLVEVLERRT